MLNNYRIRYCRTDKNGKFQEVAPNNATVFRLFINGKHFRDFFPLSQANAFIKTMRESELKDKELNNGRTGR